MYSFFYGGNTSIFLFLITNEVVCTNLFGRTRQVGYTIFIMPVRSLVALGVICALLALILILDLFALEYYLYWMLWWYDIMMHFLGGVIIGSGVLWFLDQFFSGKISLKHALFLTLGA